MTWQQQKSSLSVVNLTEWRDETDGQGKPIFEHLIAVGVKSVFGPDLCPNQQLSTADTKKCKGLSYSEVSPECTQEAGIRDGEPFLDAKQIASNSAPSEWTDGATKSLDGKSQETILSSEYCR